MNKSQPSIDPRLSDGTLTIRLLPGSLAERIGAMSDKLRSAGAVNEARKRKTGWWLANRFLGPTHRAAVEALAQ